MSSNATGPDSTLAYLVGPQVMGLFFNWGLLGVLSVQTVVYHVSFPHDTVAVKTLVYGIYVVEFVQTVLVTHDAFHWLVYSWGNLEGLEAINLSWFDVPVMAGCISTAVQLFFCWRIRVLGNMKVLPLIIAMFSVTQGISAITSGFMVLKIGTFAEINKILPVTTVWLVGSAIADVLIAGTMTYLLITLKSPFPRTDRVVNRLIRLIVETGILTATCAILDLVLFIVFQHNNLHTCPATTLAKLYSNTLLVIFNNRAFVTKSGVHQLTCATQEEGRCAASSDPTVERPGFGHTFMVNANVTDNDIPLDELEGRKIPVL
ncbi:hypothetical protein BV22DRAFT_1081427 [Leucogyrophana mollusca]|uniref:Uncharacterized protein n=1 Tax=Leucogyrophana mollusca TaxID=85980 RepID=A0ACB8BWA6_9AGAM|nr:hypothetical protein BV22DRAFT_1081427 [Leucogyrophana mollusca]